MGEHYIWLFNRSDERGFVRATLYSLLLHVLMVVIMATTSVFYPLAGNSTKIDVVWLYPSFLFGGEADTPSPDQSSPEAISPPPPVQEERTAPEPAPTPHIAASVPTRAQQAPEPAVPTQVAQNEVPPPVPTPAAEPLDMEQGSEPEMTLPVATAPAKAEGKPQEPIVKKEVTPPPEKVIPRKKEEAITKPPVEKRDLPAVDKPVVPPQPIQHPPAKTAPAPREIPPPAPKPQETPPTQPSVPAKPPVTVKQAAIKETPHTPPVAPSPPKKDSATLPPSLLQKPPLSVTNTGARRAITAEKRSEPSPAAKPAPVDKPTEKAIAQTSGPKGIFAPPLTGDLKIEVKGPEELLKAVKIAVIFREYPKSRHNRPMSRALARNFQTLTPKTARIAQNTLQAVIEVAEEGIYEFRDISDPANPGEAAFSIKVFENSGRARTRSAGNRKVGSKGSIAKVLMPEGILWDDESAFSGSMEDSESTTKFNSETGLTWKEYKE